MEQIAPEIAVALISHWRAGAFTGFVVGCAVGAFACLMIVGMIERPLKFKKAPGFRPRDRLSPEQVAQIRAAKAILQQHGYQVGGGDNATRQVRQQGIRGTEHRR